MLLETEGLTKRFGGLNAVKDVDLGIRPHEITAIIGPNGAGKSTFFNLLAGFYQPTAGIVRFKGHDITGKKTHRIVKDGVARTFQTTSLFEDSTVLENVLSGRIVRSKANAFDAIVRTPRHRREDRINYDRALEALEFASISDYRDEIASNVPQEVQKRVSIALALATEPDLMLLDEPAAGVPEEETDALSNLIRMIVDRGITVCLVEHKMSMVMSLADTIVVLDHGQELAYGSPEQVQNNPKVIEAYQGAADDDESDGT